MNTYTHWQDQRQRRAADFHPTGNGRVHQLTEELAQQDGRTESREFDRESTWADLAGPNVDLAPPEPPAGGKALVPRR